VQLPNAHIVKGEIARILPDGVVMADGIHVKLDVLVYATGFDAHAYMRPMKVAGLNGATIDEAWKDTIYSYGGIAVPGFPNLFMLYGPFAPVNKGHGMSWRDRPGPSQGRRGIRRGWSRRNTNGRSSRMLTSGITGSPIQ
jgi:cation diffusion facilitator CzcD-associated flavoprotein CzcO